MHWHGTLTSIYFFSHYKKKKTKKHSAPGSLSQLSPREAERLRDGYDSTPDPAYSCLRCSRSAQRQTLTWLLYQVPYSLLAGCSVCHFAHACPTVQSISLVNWGEPERAPCSAFNGGNVCCLSTYVRRKKISASIRYIWALILHLAGENLAASMRITRGSHYKDKSSR